MRARRALSAIVSVSCLCAVSASVWAAPAVPLTADAERAIKRAHAPAPVVALPIDWTAAHAGRQTIALPAAARAKVDAARQPVLLPTIDALTRQAFVTLGDGWYVAALAADGLHLEIQGTHRAHIRPELVAEQRAAGMLDLAGTTSTAGTPRISQMHGIYTLSFERYGVSYSIDLQCASQTDMRCADAAYLMTVFDSLAVAGGRP